MGFAGDSYSFLSSPTAPFSLGQRRRQMDRKLSFRSLSSCHLLWMRHGRRADESGERHGASFECQNWPREKGALPRAGVGLVDGEEKRMEERKPPSSLKKEGGFGSTVVVSGGRGRLQH